MIILFPLALSRLHSTAIRIKLPFSPYFPASYKKIDTRILEVPGTDEVRLTCQARGYPLAEVSWQNVSVPANTSHIRTPEGLYQVTSVLHLKPQPGRNFSCMFWNAPMQELTSAVLGPLGKCRTHFLVLQSEFR